MPSDLKLSVQSVTPDVTLTLSDPYIGSAYSPQVDVSEIEGGHEVAITYKAPSGITTDTFDVLDGVDGTDGVDGVSPTVEIESTTNAHTITITDADGAHSYTVDTYADEEAARATAESSRVAAESSRVTAEQARASAESSRAAAESARVTAEASRATAEQSRTAAESSRAEAEQSRVTAESARVTAESARATAETTRATAEQSRATAETARASAESVRVTAEQGRASAENARASAESARATAETARASAETSRTTAESARATAESTRATEWATIKAEAEDATSAAEDATDAAESAAADATAAAAEARAASAATWLAGNVLFGELAEGTVLTADDVYTAPPKGVDVFGKSTQDGTPTPDAPVPIESVDDLTLCLAGKQLMDWGNAFKRGAYHYNISVGTVINSTSSTKVNVTESGEKYDINIEAAWCGATWRSPNLPNGTYRLYVSDITFSGTASPQYGLTVFVVDKGNKCLRQINTYSSILGAKGWTVTLSGDESAICLTIGTRSSTTGTISIVQPQLELGTTATAYEPYVGQSVQIPLSNHITRSLPDGTRDTLTLSYVAPSTEHEGWGVFGVTLAQNVDAIFGSELTKYNASNGYFAYRANTKPLKANSQRCSWTSTSKSFNSSNMTEECVQFASMGSPTVYVAALENHSLDGFEFTYPLATPITHDLGTVELPILPNPLTVWADGGNAQPTLSMGYEQDINIVIARLKDAIADMATS